MTRVFPCVLYLIIGLLSSGWIMLGKNQIVLGTSAPWVEQQASTWIDTQNREASRAYYLTEYLGSSGTDSGWTGDHASCAAGTTSIALRDAILRRINYFRAMAGIPNLMGLDSQYNQEAQEAALMMSVNGTLSHAPSASWTCYTANGREAAGSSNLSLGLFGPAAISGYVQDPGSGNSPVGHRRWILYPQTQNMGTGDIPARDGYFASNVLWVFDRPNMWGPRPSTREEFVAWPPPGYLPYQIIYARWSFAYPQANLDTATVGMTKNGQPVSLQINPVSIGYGENTLVWEPQESFGQAPASDVVYDVTVSNVVIGGQPRDFVYQVIGFDPNTPPVPTATSLPTATPTATAIPTWSTPRAYVPVMPKAHSAGW